MLGIILILILPCFRYSFSAKIVPLIVAIPALGLVTLQLVMDFVPAVAKKLQRPAGEKDSSGEDEMVEKRKDARRQPLTAEISKKRNKETNIFVWVIGLMGSIYLFGYLIAVPLFLFLFLRIRASASWLLSIIVTAAMEIVVYTVFMTILRIPLYKGLILTLIFGK